MHKTVEKNLPVLSNITANVLGVFMINLVQGDITERLMPVLREHTEFLSMIYDPLAFMLCFLAVVLYERPIRRCFDYPQVTDAPKPLLALARKRLLTIPYYFMGVTMVAWLVAAILFPMVLAADGAPEMLVYRTAAQCIIIGILTGTLSFFMVEALLQRRFMNRFFPQGGVFSIKGIPRTRIVTRLFALFLITGFVPSVVTLLMAGGMGRVHATSPLKPLEVIELFSTALKTSAFLFISTGIALALLVSFTLARPLRVIVSALHDIRAGKLDVAIPVHSTDEVGYTCETINSMADGLREKERLRESLNLAGIVQKSLLPAEPPEIPGLEIATVSISCDETGGDYYDYIQCGNNQSTVSIVVGDVAGHGISSALLMTSVRAMIRTRCDLGGKDTEIMSDVNRLVYNDVGDSGNFVTLFFFSYNRENQTATWVRAGHDPAILYDPESDSFSELQEGGISLGLFDDAEFASGAMVLKKGMIILIGTDGIWETRSENDELFGKQRVRAIIREYRRRPGAIIVKEIFTAITAFRGGNPVEDDITAVVLKTS